MKISDISWTDFSSGDLNFVTGCTAVSEGCQNCYARAIYKRFGRDFDTVTMHESKLDRLCRKRFQRESPKHAAGYRPMAFVCDTGDLFHKSVSDEFLSSAFAVMLGRNDVTWQVLTKRPERMQALLSYWRSVGKYPSQPPKWIWLGVTAENQQRADERIPILLETPAAVRFVSVEPMLGPVDLRQYLYRFTSQEILVSDFTMPLPEVTETERLDWVICGAESGPDRRPFDVAWAVDLYEQCKDAGVPYFFKQGSDLRPGQHAELPGIGKVQEWPG